VQACGIRKCCAVPFDLYIIGLNSIDLIHRRQTSTSVHGSGSSRTTGTGWFFAFEFGLYVFELT
jgi:hypothetical protein